MSVETAQRVREAIQHVHQYSVDVGTLQPTRNFVSHRTGGLPASRARHYAAITDPQKLGQLLRDIRAYNGKCHRARGPAAVAATLPAC